MLAQEMHHTERPTNLKVQHLFLFYNSLVWSLNWFQSVTKKELYKDAAKYGIYFVNLHDTKIKTKPKTIYIQTSFQLPIHQETHQFLNLLSVLQTNLKHTPNDNWLFHYFFLQHTFFFFFRFSTKIQKKESFFQRRRIRDT